MMTDVGHYPESPPFSSKSKGRQFFEEQIPRSATTSEVFQYSAQRDLDPKQVECFLTSPNEAGNGIEVERGNKLSCQICKLSFDGSISRHKLLEHINSIHNFNIYDKAKICSICSSVFYTSQALKLHKINCERDSENSVSSISQLSDNSEEIHRQNQINSESNSESTECNIIPSSEDDVESSEQAKESKSENFVDLMTQKDSTASKNVSSNPFKCYICSEVIQSTRDFRSHIKSSHKNELGINDFDDLSYRCKKCATTFPNMNLLRAHFFKQHIALIIYRCTVCHVTLKTKKSLKIHYNNFHARKIKTPRSCDECGKEFANLKALKAHIRLKHGHNISKQRFRCRLCQGKFDTKEQRKLHYEEEHLGESPFICTDCGKGFSSKSGLYGHRQLHKTDQPSTCPYCDKIFNRKDSYHEHILIHVGPRHRCPHCPKEFVQRSNLVRHIRIHTGQKPYACTFCDKRFSDKGACNSHIRVHTKEEQCTCSYCGQTFTKKQKLKYHIRKHTGEGLISCEICSKTFTNGFALKEHRAIHDKQTQTICVECGKAFNSEKYLQRHVSLVHQDPEDSSITLHCPICEKTFYHQTKLKSHLVSHLGKKHLQCLICEKRYSSPKSIRNHLKQIHDLTPDQPEFKNSVSSAFESNRISLNSIKIEKNSRSLEVSAKDSIVTFLFKKESNSDTLTSAEDSFESIKTCENKGIKWKSEFCRKESNSYSSGEEETVLAGKNHADIDIKKEICYESFEEIELKPKNTHENDFSCIKTEDIFIYNQNYKLNSGAALNSAAPSGADETPNEKIHNILNSASEKTTHNMDTNFQQKSLEIDKRTMTIDQVWSLHQQLSPRQLEASSSAITRDSIQVNDEGNRCGGRNNAAKRIVMDLYKDVGCFQVLEKESISSLESPKEINRRRKQLRTPKKYVSSIEMLERVDNKLEKNIIPKKKRVEAIARSLEKLNANLK